MSDLTAKKLKKLVVAAIDYWEQNEGDMDTCMCSYLWPKLNGLVAEAVKAARVQAFEAVWLIVIGEKLVEPTLSEGGIAYDIAVDHCALAIQALIAAEKAADERIPLLLREVSSNDGDQGF